MRLEITIMLSFDRKVYKFVKASIALILAAILL